MGTVGRKRIKLVPADCIEHFEIRIALYFDSDGRTQVIADITDPSGQVYPSLHEVLGVLDIAADALKAEWYDPNPG
jgi:hypothetical protein